MVRTKFASTEGLIKKELVWMCKEEGDNVGDTAWGQNAGRFKSSEGPLVREDVS